MITKWTPRRSKGAMLVVLALSLFGIFLLPAGGATNAAPESDVARAQAPGAERSTNAWKRLAEEFVVADRTTGYQGGNEFIDFLRTARAGKTEEDGSWRAMVDKRGWLLACVLMVLGGLALNLTPCMLPMIPVNLAIIGAGAQAASRWRGLLLGGAYGTGMAVAYGVLGALIMITGSRFGTPNASPWFNAGVAALFVVLSLVVLGVIPLDFSKLQEKAKKGKKQKKGSAPVAFALGGVMALLAGACVAPVVISVMLFAGDLFVEGKTYGLLLPLLLGIGRNERKSRQ